MKRTLIALAIPSLLLVAGSVWFVTTRRVPSFGAAPLPKTVATLAQPDVEKLLDTHYQIVRHVRQIPTAIKQSFTNFTDMPFDMNDPGEPMSTDLIVAGAPSRQLIFAGVGENSAIVVYEQGGFASTPNVVIFSYYGRGGAWGATIDDYRPTDIPSLKKTVRESRCRSWKRE